MAFVVVRGKNGNRLAEILSNGQFRFRGKATSADVKKYGYHKKNTRKRTSRTSGINVGKTRRTTKTKAKVGQSRSKLDAITVALSGVDLANIIETGGCMLGKVGNTVKRVCFKLTPTRSRKRKTAR